MVNKGEIEIVIEKYNGTFAPWIEEQVKLNSVLPPYNPSIRRHNQHDQMVMADDRVRRAVQSQQGFVLHLLLVEPPHVSSAALPLHLDHNLISPSWRKECTFVWPRTLKRACEFICVRMAQKSGRLMANDRWQTTSFRSSVPTEVQNQLQVVFGGQRVRAL